MEIEFGSKLWYWHAVTTGLTDITVNQPTSATTDYQMTDITLHQCQQWQTHHQRTEWH